LQLLDSSLHDVRGEDHPAGWRWAQVDPHTLRSAEYGVGRHQSQPQQLQLQLEHAVAVQLPGWEPDECKAAAVAARAAAKVKHGSAFELAFQCRYNLTFH
jgi:hypothetical protein